MASVEAWETLTQLGQAVGLAGRGRHRAGHAARGCERQPRRQTIARERRERARRRREEGRREEGVLWAARRPRGRRRRHHGRRHRPRCLRRSRRCGGRAGVVGLRTRQLGGLPVLGGDGRHGRGRTGRRRGCHRPPRAGGRGPSPASRHGEIGPPLGGRHVSIKRISGGSVAVYLRPMSPSESSISRIVLAIGGVEPRPAMAAVSRRSLGPGQRGMYLLCGIFGCRPLLVLLFLFFLVQLVSVLRKHRVVWGGNTGQSRSVGWHGGRVEGSVVRNKEQWKASRQGGPASENFDNTRGQEGRSAVMNRDFCLQRRAVLELPSFRVHLACCRRKWARQDGMKGWMAFGRKEPKYPEMLWPQWLCPPRK